jgi:hypothetical protein
MKSTNFDQAKYANLQEQLHKPASKTIAAETGMKWTSIGFLVSLATLLLGLIIAIFGVDLPLLVFIAPIISAAVFAILLVFFRIKYDQNNKKIGDIVKEMKKLKN